jgi:hypothetical protein
MALRMDFSYFIFIFYFVRLPLCNKYSDVIMTFISIHSVIIYVVFFGAYMRCTRLYPLNPGVTNITCPARRREEGTDEDGGVDEGRAGGLLVRSVEDGRDVPSHAEPRRRTGFCSTTSVVPSS